VGAECAELSHTGSRNARYQQSHAVALGIQPLSWLSIGLSLGVYLSHLYDLTEAPDRVVDLRDDVATRYAMSYGISANFSIVRGVSSGLSINTFSPQLTPESGRYAPFFNRFTQVSVGLTLTPHAWLK